MSRLFTWAGALVALLPGVGILVTGFGAPPGYEKVCGGLVEAFGALTLLAVFLNQGKLRQSRRAVVTRAAIALGGASLALFIGYAMLHDLCVVKVPQRTPVYFPLVPCAELQGEIEKAGSRSAFVEAWGSKEADDVVRRCPESRRIATTAILLLWYAASFVTLTLAFGLTAAATRRPPDTDV